MIEPVELKDFFITFFSSAMVIVFGALYGMLFAWSRLKRISALMPLAYLSYLLLAVAVFVLAQAAHLNGYWQSLVFVMLVGYLLAPQAIWHLCVRTHEADHTSQSEPDSKNRLHPTFKGEHQP